MNPKRISRLLSIVIMVLGCFMLSGVIIGITALDIQSVLAFSASTILTWLTGTAFFLFGFEREDRFAEPSLLMATDIVPSPEDDTRSWSITQRLGVIITGFGIAMVAGVVFALMQPQRDPLFIGGLATLVLAGLLFGGVFFIYGRRDEREEVVLQPREAIVVVSLSWLFLGVLGAVPFMLDGSFTDFSDALFESVAGFTTTGSTVLTEIEQGVSRAGHFWRCLTHWLGGVGIVVLFVAIFPQLGVGGKQLFKTEVPGPITDGLRPKITETSKALWVIYIGLTALNFALLWALTPMDWFDALCHAFSTLATGGFSTQNASVGAYQSVRVDVITTLFMFMAGVNFSLYYLAFAQGQLRRALGDVELWSYTIIVAVAIGAITLSLWYNADTLAQRPGHPPGVDYNNGLQALRFAAFQVLAVVTTTGFGTDNFDEWPNFVRVLLVFLMFMGGCAGSTAGGIKVFRVVVVFKAILIEIKRVYRPEVVYILRMGKATIPQSLVHGIVVFFALFVMIFVVVTLFITAFGHDLVTSATATVACLASIGPGLAKVNGASNFAFFEAPIKVVLSFCMILGRLELMTIMVLFMPSFWRR